MAFNPLRSRTVQCIFDRKSLRPTGFEIHSWIRDTLRLPREVVLGLQIDFYLYSVFLKLSDDETCDKVVSADAGVRKFKHVDGTISDVRVQHAGQGVRDVRVFNVPFECPDSVIESALRPYGTVVEDGIKSEMWQEPYYYQVDSGVRNVRINLKKHIPSYLIIGGSRAFVSYPGQPQTCGICNTVGHLRGECPNKDKRPVQLPRETSVADGTQSQPLFSDIVQGFTAPRPETSEGWPVEVGALGLSPVVPVENATETSDPIQESMEASSETADPPASQSGDVNQKVKLSKSQKKRRRSKSSKDSSPTDDSSNDGDQAISDSSVFVKPAGGLRRSERKDARKQLRTLSVESLTPGKRKSEDEASAASQRTRRSSQGDVTRTSDSAAAAAAGLPVVNISPMEWAAELEKKQGTETDTKF